VNYIHILALISIVNHIIATHCVVTAPYSMGPCTGGRGATKYQGVGVNEQKRGDVGAGVPRCHWPVCVVTFGWTKIVIPLNIISPNMRIINLPLPFLSEGGQDDRHVLISSRM